MSDVPTRIIHACGCAAEAAKHGDRSRAFIPESTSLVGAHFAPVATHGGGVGVCNAACLHDGPWECEHGPV